MWYFCEQNLPIEFDIRIVRYCDQNVTSFCLECRNNVLKLLSSGRKCWLLGTGTSTIWRVYLTQNMCFIVCIRCSHKALIYMMQRKYLTFFWFFKSESYQRQMGGSTRLVFITSILTLFASPCRTSSILVGWFNYCG